MSLRGIDRHGFPEESMSGGRGSIFLASSPTASPSTNNQVVDTPRFSHELNAKKAVGRGMTMTGLRILMVPDPLPLVDEIVGVGLVVGGVVLQLSD